MTRAAWHWRGNEPVQGDPSKNKLLSRGLSFHASSGGTGEVSKPTVEVSVKGRDETVARLRQAPPSKANV
jgi:hypothetical protein